MTPDLNEGHEKFVDAQVGLAARQGSSGGREKQSGGVRIGRHELAVNQSAGDFSQCLDVRPVCRYGRPGLCLEHDLVLIFTLDRAVEPRPVAQDDFV